MIQRKQTLFLLEVVFLAIALLFVPSNIIVKPNTSVNLYLLPPGNAYESSIWHDLAMYLNFICLVLLLNIVINALFSAPSPLQKFAFDQPNIAILNFPFSWLPTFIVPIVLFGHLTSIRQLTKIKSA